MQITFDIIRTAWAKLTRENRSTITTTVPQMQKPETVLIRKISEDDENVIIEFYGFESSMVNNGYIPMAHRMVVGWVKSFSMSVNVVNTPDQNRLRLKVSKMSKLGEGRKSPVAPRNGIYRNQKSRSAPVIVRDPIVIIR